MRDRKHEDAARRPEEGFSSSLRVWTASPRRFFHPPSFRSPLVCEIELEADDLLRALLALGPARRVSILDSGGARAPDARYLIAGFDPFETIEARGGRLCVRRRGLGDESIERADVLDALDDRLKRYELLPGPRPAAGACIATLAYDLVHRLEPLRAGRKLRASGEPDAALAFYDTLIIHDYAHKSTKIISVAGPEGIETVYRAVRESLRKASREPVREPTEPPASLLRAATSPHPAHTARVRSNLSRDAYIAAVRRIKDHIFAGDIYQANLTQRFRYRLAPSTGPEQIFWRLRRDHPASFAAFIRRRDDVVISASPERFLRVRTGSAGRQIEAWPIKGTRPRGVNQDEDARLCRELLASEKDRAENIMIVDLVRNDLGRVCCYGSVEVTELCSIQEHPTLFHLVSKVRGTLRREATAGDILRATFPCGSITGAPKIRAMEIISEVEPSARGLSMGAIGYFSFDGAMDLNVAIRTMVIRDRVARFNTGGGIVADSDPALEYEESLVKARALLRALKDEKMPER